MKSTREKATEIAQALEEDGCPGLGPGDIRAIEDLLLVSSGSTRVREILQQEWQEHDSLFI